MLANHDNGKVSSLRSESGASRKFWINRETKKFPMWSQIWHELWLWFILYVWLY